MGCKAAVQALQKADILKTQIYRKSDLLNDSQAWTNQQQLQTIYHQVLVLDLEYALDKKVEQELWTVGFKNYISILQEQARDKKNPHRSDSQALLSWCLEAASGFYLTLLHELCIAFDLDLPFRKRLQISGNIKLSSSPEQINPPQASSCIYICQYCLVHLGDIARYRNQRKQAESFYKHAILLSPTSGQPYNQLALLEASQGDKLAAIFYYVRGIAVKNPFPATATNLANTFLNAVDKDDLITEVQTKLTANEFIRMFVTVHGLIYSAVDLDQAELQVKSLNATLTPLVATQSFTKKKLLQMTVINLYALKHTVGAGTLKTEELTADEIIVRRLVLDLLAGSLSAFLLPIYTLNQDYSLLDYHALSAIKFILYWLKSDPEILKESVFTTRLQIWPGLCKLLNSVQSYLKEFNYNNFLKIPLSEDVDLQGFLPLAEYFSEFDFNAEKLECDSEIEKLIRIKRLIEFGMWLTTIDVNSGKLIVIKDDTDEKNIIFEPGCVQPDPTIKLLEEMKSFNIVESIQVMKTKGSEKRGGILKPQGSLEKSRKEQEAAIFAETSNTSSASPPSVSNAKPELVKQKRVSQNVALQSIFKKIEENKQVKFDMGNVEKEKSKSDIKLPAIKTLPSSTYANPTYRSNVNFSQSKTNSNDLNQDYFKNGFPNYGSVPYERTSMPNISFSPSDVPAIGSDLKNLTQNFSIPPPNVFNSQSLQNHPQSFHQRTPSNQQMPNSYSNISQFSQSQDFKTWLQEERAPQNWWPNSTQPMSSNYQQRDYQVNYPYCNNMQYVPNPNMDFNKPPQGPNMGGSPWGTNPNTLPANSPLDHSNQALSLRQAMLKETHNLSSMQQNALPPNRDNPEKMVPPTNQPAPGYSLFNSNIWSPSVPGQFRNSESPSEGLLHNLRQQSLFSRQPPLQQLLERQNQLKKGDS